MLSLVGQKVSHYRILEELGGGGMGVVYKAEDSELERTVALKFLPPHLTCDPEAKERFIHEARAASALDHPNICTIHEIGHTDEGQLFICMALYSGETVKKKIERGPLPISEAVSIATQVAHGLSKAHAQRVIHRDIKPANIMVTGDGVAKIVDFGLAKLTGMTQLTVAGQTLGTVAYMSPEQARGEPADGRTDIWSLGAMLYEMVTGKLPFKGDYGTAVVYSILNSQPESIAALRTGVPAELNLIIQKCLAKDPSERYQHAEDLAADLNALETGSQTATRPSVAAPLKTKARRAWWKRMLIPSLVFGAILAAFLMLRPMLFDEILISEPKPIAVITFANQTGDKSFDYLQEAIPNLLITSLEQSRYLHVMTWERMRDILAQMGKKDVVAIDKDLAFELCQREGITAVVIGSFIKAGETFATDIKVVDVGSKELLKTASARGKGVQSILDDQIDELSREIARGVGLSQRRIASSSSQIADVTTNSMEAYNYYLRGTIELDKMYYGTARQFLESAVALDSTFAMAYLGLYSAHFGIGKFGEALRVLGKAKELASKAPEKERLYIESTWASAVEKDSKKRLGILREIAEKYPNEKRVHYLLASTYRGRDDFQATHVELDKALALDPNYAIAVNERAYAYTKQGLFEKAIETFQRYATLSPGDANPFDSMAELYLVQGKLDDAATKYREAARVQPTFISAYKSLAYVLALKEDYFGSLNVWDTVARSEQGLGHQADMRGWRSFYSILAGKVKQTGQEINTMETIMSRVEDPMILGPLYFVRGWTGWERGLLDSARRDLRKFAEVYSLNRPKSPNYVAAVKCIYGAWCTLGSARLDSGRTLLLKARRFMDSAEAKDPNVQTLAGIVEAEILLEQGSPQAAIQTYRSTPVVGPSMGVGYFMPMYNVPLTRDVVPRAFLAMGSLDSAITAYEQLISIDPNSRDRRLINPRYHYRLAKLYEQAGRKNQAKVQYQRLLDIWRLADKDLPELVDARKRLMKLG